MATAAHLVICTVTGLVQQVCSLVLRPATLIDALNLANVSIGASLLGCVMVL